MRDSLSAELRLMIGLDRGIKKGAYFRLDDGIAQPPSSVELKSAHDKIARLEAENVRLTRELARHSAGECTAGSIKSS